MLARHGCRPGSAHLCSRSRTARCLWSPDHPQPFTIPDETARTVMIETNTSDPQTAITEMTQQIVRPNGAQFDFSGVKWSWACRGLSPEELPGKCCLLPDNLPPRIADVVLVRVERVGHHGRIDTQSGG